MPKKALQVLKAKVGVKADQESLLPCFPLGIEVRSLLTDFNNVLEIPFTGDLDGYIEVEDRDAFPSLEIRENKVIFKGPFSKLAAEASDQRYTFWGNQGFLYRYILFLLEKHYGIYSFHACALFHEEQNSLFVIIGGVGSGKTVYLLSGIQEGLSLFSTETVHFQISGEGSVTWHIGSQVDNIRLGTLFYHFPRFLPEIPPPDPDEMWEKKIALDLSEYKTTKTEINDPESVYILFPRIEEGREGIIMNTMNDERKTAKVLFDNLSQKISETFILYDRFPVQGFENESLAQKRLDSVYRFVRTPSIKQVASVLTNPKECWGDILQKIKKEK